MNPALQDLLHIIGQWVEDLNEQGERIASRTMSHPKEENPPEAGKFARSSMRITERQGD
jgi:hypothetical protein